MRKIELDQGRARACKCDGFHDLVTFDEAPGPFRARRPSHLRFGFRFGLYEQQNVEYSIRQGMF